MLFGLYLLTPILRIFIAHANQTMIKYFIVLWLFGVAIVPVFSLVTPITLNSQCFDNYWIFVGYFVLGTFLLMVFPRRLTFSIFIVLGMALTAVATYVLAFTVGGIEMYFFQQYLSPTVILASTMLFMLLLTVKPPPAQQEVKPTIISRIIKKL